MKTFTVLNLIGIICLQSIGLAAPQAAEKRIKLTTLSGKVYHQAQIMEADPDGLRIIHADGAAKIPFTDLSETWRRKYDYDADKAAAFKAAQEKKMAAERAAMKKIQDQTAEEQALIIFQEFRADLLAIMQQNEYNFSDLDGKLSQQIATYRDTGREAWAKTLEADREQLKQRELQRPQLEMIRQNATLEAKNAALQDQIDSLQKAVATQSTNDPFRPTKRITIYSNPFPYQYYYNQPYTQRYYYYNQSPLRPIHPTHPCPPLRPVPR